MSRFTPSSMFRSVLTLVGLLLLWGPVSGMAQPKCRLFLAVSPSWTSTRRL